MLKIHMLQYAMYDSSIFQALGLMNLRIPLLDKFANQKEYRGFGDGVGTKGVGISVSGEYPIVVLVLVGRNVGTGFFSFGLG